jgi:hypothetical protein
MPLRARKNTRTPALGETRTTRIEFHRFGASASAATGSRAVAGIDERCIHLTWSDATRYIENPRFGNGIKGGRHDREIGSIQNHVRRDVFGGDIRRAGRCG